MVRWIFRGFLLLIILLSGLAGFTGCVTAAESSADDDSRGLYGSLGDQDLRSRFPDDPRIVSEDVGDLFLAQGRPYQALRIYLAVLGSDDSPSGNSVERAAGLLEKCRSIVERIRVEPLTAGMTVKIGYPFPSPFQAQVRFDDQETGLPDVRLLVKHKIPDGSAPGSEAVLAFVSDAGGRVRYTPSVPFFEGNGAVYVSLDLEGELAKIDDHGFSGTGAEEALHALRSSINGVQAVFPYRVEKAEEKAVLGVLFADRDNAGKPTGSSYTASGIAGAFDSSIFDVKILDAAEEPWDGDFQEAARRFADVHGSTGWFIYGNAQISEYEERNGRIYINVSGSARAAYLSSEKPDYSTGILKKSVIGGNSQNTVVSAYRQLGKLIGAELIKHLK